MLIRLFIAAICILAVTNSANAIRREITNIRVNPVTPVAGDDVTIYLFCYFSESPHDIISVNGEWEEDTFMVDMIFDAFGPWMAAVTWCVPVNIGELDEGDWDVVGHLFTYDEEHDRTTAHDTAEFNFNIEDSPEAWPNLTLTDYHVSRDRELAEDDSFRVSYTISNTGEEHNSDTTWTSIYFSDDDILSANDKRNGRLYHEMVDPLDPENQRGVVTPYFYLSEGTEPGDRFLFIVVNEGRRITAIDAFRRQNIPIWDYDVNERFTDDNTVLIPLYVGYDPGVVILPFRPGWNLAASPASPEANDMEDVFAPLVESGNLVMVKDGAGRFYTPEWDYNGIPPWSPLEGYFVLMREADSLVIEGEATDPATPITLTAGWNQIAYLKGDTLEADVAFRSIADVLIIAKDDRAKFYAPQFGFSNMPPLHRGKGYMVKVSEAREFIWAAGEEEEE